MRRKFSKIAKKALALGLSLGMLASTTVFAASSEGKQEITTTTNKSAYIYDVTLPTSYNIALDPYQMNSATGTGINFSSQIYTVPFTMYNASNIPVKISIYPYLVVGDDVNVVASFGAVTTDAAIKNIFVQATPISSSSIVTNGAIITTGQSNQNGKHTAGKVDTSKITVTTGSINFDGANTVTLSAISSSSISNLTQNVSGIAFILNKAEYSNFGIANSNKVFTANFPEGMNKNYASFELLGGINPNADWEDSDVSIKMVYDLKGYSKDSYDSNYGGTGDGKISRHSNAIIGGANTDLDELDATTKSASLKATAKSSVTYTVTSKRLPTKDTKINGVFIVPVHDDEEYDPTALNSTPLASFSAITGNSKITQNSTTKDYTIVITYDANKMPVGNYKIIYSTSATTATSAVVGTDGSINFKVVE